MPATIMVVEKTKNDFLRMLRDNLEDDGRVVLASLDDDIAALFEKHRPSVMLVAGYAGGVTNWGVNLIESLRARGHDPRFIANSGDPSTQRELLAAGAELAIRKERAFRVIKEILMAGCFQPWHVPIDCTELFD